MPPCYSMNNAEKGESRAPCSAAAPESRAERIQLNARARKRRCVFCKCAQDSLSRFGYRYYTRHENTSRKKKKAP